MRIIPPFIRRFFSLRAVSAFASLASLVVLLRANARERSILVRIAALESRPLTAPVSVSSVVASSPAAPALVDTDAGAAGSDSFYSGLTRSTAPQGWRYSVARGRPCLVLPSGRYLVEGTACAYGVIRAILPDCVITDSYLLEFSQNDFRSIRDNT